MSLLHRIKGYDQRVSQTSPLSLLGRTRTVWLVVLIILGLLNIAEAGSLGVSPVRVDLSTQQRVASITVTNSSNEPKTIQMRLYKWHHDGTQTNLEKTKDILPAPPIAVIPPKQSQLLRVGLRTKPGSKLEKSYRLMIEEIPSQQNVGVALALRISIPVFVKPEVSVHAQLSWSIESLNGKKFLRVDNHGNGHAKLNDFKVAPAVLKTAAPTSNVYVLPGAHFRWELTSQFNSHQALQVEAIVHGKEISLAVPPH
ncbi:molecular chaperone [Pseudidiomarina sp.]|uniref:fimbrial biogenesis chaperone n=1 Tax=Pseudidiomarina sp. TaxID=2081707 RepID=UPI003A975E2C